MAVPGDEDVFKRFAIKLAGNEKKLRDLALKKLRKYVEARSRTDKGWTESELITLWKGLHYSMWMCDKPLVQEDLAERLSLLVHSFKNTNSSLLFIKSFLETECREWFGIDRLRLDKFMMLVRRVFRQGLVLLRNNDWDDGLLNRFLDVIGTSVLQASNHGHGLQYHLADIYWQELKPFTELPDEKKYAFFTPWLDILGQIKSDAFLCHALSQIFDEPLTKPFGEEDDTERLLEVDIKIISENLFQVAKNENCRGKNRKRIYSLVKRLQDVAERKLPVEQDYSSGEDFDEDKALRKLQSFEDKLMLKTKGKKRRHSDVDEDESSKKKKRKKLESSEVTAEKPEKTKITKNKFKKKKSATTTDALNIDRHQTAENNGCSNITKGTSAGKKQKKSSTADKVDTVQLSPEDATMKLKKKRKKDKVILDSCNSGMPKRNSLSPIEIHSSGEQDVPFLSSDLVLNTSELAADSERTSINEKVTPKRKKKGRHSSQFLHLNGGFEETQSTPKKDDIPSTQSFTQTSPNSVTKSKQTLVDNSFPIAVSTGKGKKSKEKSPNNKNNENTLLDEEQEIWIPNKKYKGALAGMYEKAAKASAEHPFMRFTQLQKLPSAFVKRALTKVSPQSEPRKQKVKVPIAPGSAPNERKKRVSFGMNMAQDYRESLTVSPVVPYSPRLKPEHGILKAGSPDTQHVTPLNSGGIPKVQLFNPKRSKASDFF